MKFLLERVNEFKSLFIQDLLFPDHFLQDLTWDWRVNNCITAHELAVINIESVIFNSNKDSKPTLSVGKKIPTIELL